MRRTIALSLALALGLAAHAGAERTDTAAGPADIALVADGFGTPWSFDFLPGGAFAVSEREGRLWIIGADGTRREVTGLPEIAVTGQGGLLDVMVPRDFAQTRELLFTYAAPQRGGAGTAVGAGRLSEDGTRLEDVRTLFELTPGSSGGRHFGSRLVEAPDGHIFVTVGDRGDRPSAQDLSVENGSVLRIARDGSIPADNPFVAVEGAQPEIWSYGHRNPQGASLDLDGTLWVHEHGARGGDEINRIEPGANYGWPVISYGRHYSGARIGEGTSKSGMEQPEFYWDPSIAPSGMAIYSGALWPEWRGHIFAGSLNSDFLVRVGGRPLAEAERIATPQTRRVRDVTEGPDGAIWFISEGNGAIYRMTPAPGE